MNGLQKDTTQTEPTTLEKIFKKLKLNEQVYLTTILDEKEDYRRKIDAATEEILILKMHIEKLEERRNEESESREQKIAQLPEPEDEDQEDLAILDEKEDYRRKVDAATEEILILKMDIEKLEEGRKEESESQEQKIAHLPEPEDEDQDLDYSNEPNESSTEKEQDSSRH